MFRWQKCKVTQVEFVANAEPFLELIVSKFCAEAGSA